MSVAQDGAFQQHYVAPVDSQGNWAPVLITLPDVPGFNGDFTVGAQCKAVPGDPSDDGSGYGYRSAAVGLIP